MGISCGPEITDWWGERHHVEAKENAIRIWDAKEQNGMRLSYEEALKLANSLRLHIQIQRPDMELD